MNNSPTTLDVESLILRVKKLGAGRLAFRCLAWLETSSAYRIVVNDYLALNAPPTFDFPKSIGNEFTESEAIHSAEVFAWNLLQLSNRVTHAEAGDGIEWERKWIKTQSAWKDKQAKLVSLLLEAANLVDLGQCDPGLYASLVGYREQSKPDYCGVDEIPWCGTENLRRWAEVVKMSPVEVVFPKARPHPIGRMFRPGSLGRRGGASRSDGALRAMVVRELAYHVPVSMLIAAGIKQSPTWRVN